MVREASAADYDTLMREGIELRRSGDDEGALRRFQESYALGKTPKAMAQIGMAEQALGRWAPADMHLRQALQSENDPWISKNRSPINEALSVVASHVGQLQVTGVPPGAEVRIDGQLVGKLPLPNPTTVTAGGVAIEVRAPGFLPIVRAATVAPRTLTRETFTLQALSPTGDNPVASASSVPLKAASPPDAQVQPSPATEREGDDTNSTPSPVDASTPTLASGRHRTILVLTSIGLSAAALAFGVYEHITWQNKIDTFAGMTNVCGTSLVGQGGPGCQQLRDDGERARLLAFVGYGVGAAFGIAALVLYLTDSGDAREPRKVACAPAGILPGVTCGLRF